jgi:uncharacterized protein YkwD
MSNDDHSWSIMARERVKLLCEMFPALSVDTVLCVVEEASEATPTTQLVDKCLDLLTSSDVKQIEDETDTTDSTLSRSSDELDKQTSLITVDLTGLEPDDDSTSASEHQRSELIGMVSLDAVCELKSTANDCCLYVPEVVQHRAVPTPVFQTVCRAVQTSTSSDCESDSLPNSDARSSTTAALKLIRRILGNIVKRPDCKKYRSLNVAAPKLRQVLQPVPHAMAIVESIGFQYVIRDDGKNSGTGSSVSSQNVPSSHGIRMQLPLHGTAGAPSIDELHSCIRLLTCCLGGVSRQQADVKSDSHHTQSDVSHIEIASDSEDQDSDTVIAHTTRKQSSSHTERPSRKRRKSATGTIAPVPALRTRLTPTEMEQLVKKRLRISENKASDATHSAAAAAVPIAAAGNQGITRGRISDFAQKQKLKRDIESVRQLRANRWRKTAHGRKRVFTLSEISAARKERERIVANFSSNATPAGGTELEQIGRKALQLTNEFRAKHNKPPLAWHSALHDIGYVHSCDMGVGKVPFSHVGFKQRVKKYPFSNRGAAENLAMSKGCSNIASVAVDGWIKSPGHCKNLLSNMTYCAISVYRNSDNAYYLTQLFALV